MPLSSAHAIALNRFGIGARADEPAPADPKRWLLDQFGRYDPRPPAWAGTQATPQLAAEFAAARREAKQQSKTVEEEQVKVAKMLLRQETRDHYREAVNARAACTLLTPAPFVERLVWFWANHFAVSADKVTVIPFAGAYEAEAIRPHVLGRFEDLLLAAERHPAMQLYLDQARSAGPNSRLAMLTGLRDPEKKAGLNENLAREILELHTLGVRTGYAQADVTEFARALTGWSIGGLGGASRPDPGQPGDYIWRPALHEPGSRIILGKTYAQEGEAQPLAVLHDLCTSSATAHHIATKLARHFVADDPPPALVDRLAAEFLASGGDLPRVYRVLIEAPEAWAPGPGKFKSPWEWAISAMRGIGIKELGGMQVSGLMTQLGEPVWRPGSPAGYDDLAASWAAPDALVRRVELAQRFASRVGDRLDARTLGDKLLPAALGPATREAIARADAPPTALALLLVSPEFQRR